MTMHNRSKAHKEWEAALSDAGITVEAVAVSEDNELEGILVAARKGEDIRHLAKMARSIFAARGWPNEDHPGSIQEWLESHNIPTINVPSHSDPDEQRKYISEETERFRQAGWGKSWNIT
tara:strand:- start:39 stop:398 length:360 start_codon:yes stop_codon:yes gene_type:complete